jgi:lipoic acid synthetase
VLDTEKTQNKKKPSWLKVKFPSEHNFFHVSSVLKREKLHTICQNAQCPNISECWSKKTATFLILGTICTRECSFCAVEKGLPAESLSNESSQVADAADLLGLRYAVITSVTRDDLPDGGASVFAETIHALKERIPGVKIEVLIPDFQGNEMALETVIRAQPDVLNHNIETTESCYPLIRRPIDNYRRSLGVLHKAKKLGAETKSGIMVGLGETRDEIAQTFSDISKTSCSLLTIGQYLQPSRSHVPVRKYYSPSEFKELKTIALEFGFRDVVSGPLVRSSYMAHKMYDSLQEKAV